MTKEKIYKFFQEQLSREDSERVGVYLKENPAVLNEYLNEEEWKMSDGEVSGGEEARFRVWSKISANLDASRRSVTKPWRPFLAAASLILILFGIWMLLGKEEKTAPSPVAHSSSMEKIIENKNNDTLGFYTPDGSIVYLLPKSSVAYTEPFTERSIRLEGEAIFNVAKDSSRPFVVRSGALSTIVLGTIFTVRTFQMEPLITVHLFEGKIIVKENANANEQHTLRPGQTLFYNKVSNAVTVVSPKQKRAVQVPGTLPRNPLPEVGEKHLSENHWYMFGNQPLSEVLNELARLYETEIVYEEEDVKGMTFIAKLDKTDSLERILQSIASLNGLTLTKSGGKYILHKNK